MTLPSSETPSSECPSMSERVSFAARFESCFERVFFNTRWIIAPIYAGLAGGLIVVLIKFVQLLVKLIMQCWGLTFDEVSLRVLDLVDLALLANLLLIVMFAGYENYVSRLDLRDHADYPHWMGHVTFGDIKVKVMASIVAMSAIHLLADFIRVDELSTRVLAWSVGIHMAFVVSGVLIAIMDRLTEHKEPLDENKSKEKH